MRRLSTAEPGFEAAFAALLDEARRLGLKVLPWTVNDPAQMTRLVEWGVDGLITDRPDLLREVLQRLGRPVPPPR